MNSKPSCLLRGTTLPKWHWPCSRDFNPHAPCGARHVLPFAKGGFCISIHVPLAGHDMRLDGRRVRTTDFNPRAPCGARRVSDPTAAAVRIFQSTCPLRGTTYRKNGIDGWILFQSTCPLRGTTVPLEPCGCLSAYFNPRAPCGARQSWRLRRHHRIRHFNPRAPCGARLSQVRSAKRRRRHFNPRAPCGARQRTRALPPSAVGRFQSTCPLRGTTSSSHGYSDHGRNFNPRAPCGARPCCPDRSCLPSQHFNPRAPCGRGPVIFSV